MLKSVLFFALTQLRGARAPTSVLMGPLSFSASFGSRFSFRCPRSLQHFFSLDSAFSFLSRFMRISWEIERLHFEGNRIPVQTLFRSITRCHAKVNAEICPAKFDHSKNVKGIFDTFFFYTVDALYELQEFFTFIFYMYTRRMVFLCFIIFRVNMKTIVAISLTFVGIYRSSTKKKIKISLYSIQLQNNGYRYPRVGSLLLLQGLQF